jgi:hypothetical protein
MDFLVDILYGGAILLFFALTWAFARGCSRLEGKQ